MAGLSAKWEWDYDGRRWFYRHMPTGHVQYHFPSEGDEFPEFVFAQAGEEALRLAPEERLESQQQLRRQTFMAAGSNDGACRALEKRAEGGGSVANSLGMSARAEPVSVVWEDDDADGAVFQPESLMFLGAGTDADVSPLNEGAEEKEEEEAARAVTRGVGEEERKHDTSQPVVEADAASMLLSDTQPVHILDSREMPLEMLGDVATPHRFDPVGIMAEMPAGQTGPEHIERHSNPVEMADHSILTPIETLQYTMTHMAELPAKSSRGDAGDEKAKNFGIVQTPGDKISSSGQAEARMTGAITWSSVDTNQGSNDAAAQDQRPEARPSEHQSPSPGTDGEPSSQNGARVEETRSMARKQPGSAPPGTPVLQSTYQAYVPGQLRTPPVPVSDSKRQSMPLQREALLMLESGRRSSSVDLSTIPKALSPPYEPAKMVPQTTVLPSVTVERYGKDGDGDWDARLARFPSVLKPGRKRTDSTRDVASVQQAQQQQQQQQQGTHEPQISQPAGPQDPSHMQAVYKVPFGMRPVHTRSGSQPGLLITGRQTVRNTNTAQPDADQSHASRLQSLANAAVQETCDTRRFSSQNWQRPWQGQKVPTRSASAMPSVHQGQAQYGGPVITNTSAPSAAAQYQIHASRQIEIAARPPPRPQTVLGTMHHDQQREQKPPPAAASIFNIPPLRHVHNAAAGQQVKPQSPLSDEYQQAASSRQQTDPLGLMHPDLRRVSSFTPAEQSPIRPRTDSQVSSITQSSADSYRHRSSNALDCGNGTSYTPSPLTDSSGPVGLNQQSAAAVARMSAHSRKQSPAVPAEIREHAEGSFFPVQSAPEVWASENKALPEEHLQQQHYHHYPCPVDSPQSPLQQIKQEKLPPDVPPKVSPTHPPQQQAQPYHDSQYPVGYRVESPRRQSAPAAPANQRNNVTASSGTGDIVGGIEEHETQGQTSMPLSTTPHATRPSSVVSSLPSLRQSISHTSSSPQPKPLTPSQDTGSGQQLSQQLLMAQPTISIPCLDENLPGAMSTGQIQSQMPPEPIPQGSSQGHAKGQWSPAASQVYPPQGLHGPKDKQKKWMKWFKGSSRKSNAPLHAQMMASQPGPIPRLIPGTEPHQWTGGPFSPLHIQQPREQSPTETVSRGQRQSSMSDSAWISTAEDRDERSQHEHGQRLLPGQAPEPLPQNQVPGPSSRPVSVLPPSRQVFQGQDFQAQGQRRPEQMPMTQRQMPQMSSGPPSQRHSAPPLRPSQNGLGQPFQQNQPLPDQTRPRQSSHGQNTIDRTASQSGFQPQSQSSGAFYEVHLQKQPLPQQTQSQSHRKQQNPMPAPLFANLSGSHPASMQAHQGRANQQVVAINKWAQKSTMDYSGSDWGG
ncbi:hypothetical protein E4U55_002317 [Claviceps digitariae]|nr:hypothetical protein E4U55_002317 [Claviceps digitariae]